ncbi:aldehyde dehydrogenase family protein [Shouchella hunanensis]|uniref:Aldehyde dehydrogenase family protein n=1 Tax=Shouchella hunanensis TaxID=766894 RepID=A0ABY7W6E8_9BACI|nr:aldehyde dehydrogenase family protein [Shouchella hunanensis]WDF03445.1 aldehyde dehydrogenase family protein [Shouchella hunanensis]GAF23795.1 aldehyde dehydrogenase [Bacillus sp. JCM 19047]
MTSTYHNYIGGKWIPSESEKTFASINPGKANEILGYFPNSTVYDTRSAIKVAEEAFPFWRSITPIQRVDILYRLIRLLEDEKKEVALLISTEVGKTVTAAEKEVDATIQALKHFSGAANRLAGETLPSIDPNYFTYTIKEPLGAVGVITPFNFPLGIGVYKIAPAMLAGNTVVYKPPNDTARIAIKLVELFERAGMPAGVLNLVFGDGDVVGKEMGENASLKAISFTGSTAVGLKLGQTVSARGGKMQAELGGKNATILLEDANLDEAINGIMISGMYNNGQSCTGTSRVIVLEEIAEVVLEKLKAAAQAIRVGYGQDEGIENGAVANEKQLHTYLHYIQSAKEAGAKIECGGKRLTENGLDQGYFVAPTVISHVTSDMAIAQEEIFGPVVAVMIVQSYAEAIQLANDTSFGLSSSIYTNDLAKAQAFIQQIEVGVAHVNIPSNYYENQLPFGGKKQSSIGLREQGSTALDFWLDTKAVYIKS